MIQNGSKIIYEWFYKNKTPILISFAIGLLVYFQFYANLLSNPDGVLYWDQINTPSWVLTHGGWGEFIIDYIKPNINTVPLAIFFALFFYCIAGILFVEIFSIDNVLIKILVSACILCSPVVPSTLTYPYIAYNFSVSFLLAIMSVKIFVKGQNSFWGLLCTYISLTLTIGTGTTNVGTAAGAAIMYLTLLIIEKKDDIKSWFISAGKILSVGLLGIATYYIILKLLLAVKGMQMSTYGGGDKINFLYIIVNLPRTVQYAYSNFIDFFFHSNIMINSFAIKELYACMFILFAIMVICGCYVMRKRFNSLVVYIACILIIPIACNLINLFTPDHNYIDLHMAGGMNLFISFAFLMFVVLLSKIKIPYKAIIKLLGSILMVCLIWNYVLIDCADAALMQVTKDLTISLGNRVYTNVEADERFTDDTRLVVIGTPDYAITQIPYFESTNTYARWGMFWSSSFYTSLGWNMIFRHYIDGNVQWGSWDDINSVIASDTYKNMPKYPDDGSMQIINNVFVVKIAN